MNKLKEVIKSLEGEEYVVKKYGVVGNQFLFTEILIALKEIDEELDQLKSSDTINHTRLK